MTKIINLDRSCKTDISYPIGVTESIKYTNNDVTELTDVYEIVIATQGGVIIETISEGSDRLTKVDNYFTWVFDYEHDEIAIAVYNYEIRNITQDYIEFRGKITVTKTIE